jgi:hypothetical protein
MSLKNIVKKKDTHSAYNFSIKKLSQAIFAKGVIDPWGSNITSYNI